MSSGSLDKAFADWDDFHLLMQVWRMEQTELGTENTFAHVSRYSDKGGSAAL
jgi:hypothetical protein